MSKMRTKPPFSFLPSLTQHFFVHAACFSLQCGSNHGSGHQNLYTGAKNPPESAPEGAKYLSNIIEQDYHFIKLITLPILGFRTFHSAAGTLAVIEAAHMIQKGQSAQTGVSPFKQLAALAA